MTKLLAFLFTITIGCAAHKATAQSFTFTIASPVANSASDSVLNINVRYYTSTYELLRITAVTEGRMDTLSNAGNAGGYFNFNGSINIAGLIQGNTYTLRVTCRDVLGNEQSDSVNYKYINPPIATIISPVPGTDIWPSLRIKTSHTGFDTCTSTVRVAINSNTVFTYTAVFADIDTTIMLSNSLNGTGNVALTVMDKWGQSSSVNSNILADNYHSYPYLTPVYTGGKILDYNYNKILESKNRLFYIVDSGFQTSSAIPGYAIPSYLGTTIPAAQLTPYGAIWNGYEWTNGVLLTHSYSGYGGPYATYKAIWYDTIFGGSGYALYRRDLGTRTNIEINHNYDLPQTDATKVDPRGSVIFYNGDYSAMGRYKVNGGSNYIASANPPYVFGGSLLYGDTVIYSIARVENPTSSSIYFNNGINNTILSQFNSSTSAPYRIAGTYIAFPKSGTTNQKQIWLRDSTGNSVQRTFFGTDSYVIGLNAEGDILFNNSNKCYYLKKDSINPKEIGTALSPASYKENAWYIIKDNTLYTIAVNAYRSIAAGNWSNPASWEGNTVPLPNADVIVTTNITVDTDITCNTLKVIPPGSITVLPGVNLVVLH